MLSSDRQDAFTQIRGRPESVGTIRCTINKWRPTDSERPRIGILPNLRHAQLLDAAHILPDSNPLGAPLVSNGLALCKLHHAAFDQNFIAVRPDLVIQVRRDILDEEDGPMLVHGLQEFHERRILVPRRSEERPRPELLEERYRRFLAASPT